MSSTDYDLHINIMQPFWHLYYDATLPHQAVPLAFVSAPALDAYRNLEITRENRGLLADIAAGTEMRLTESVFAVPAVSFLMTDVFNRNTQGSLEALYYVHDLPLDSKDGSLVYVYDQNMQAITTDWLHWHTEQENSIYSNLVSRYDPLSQQYTLYFVSYVDGLGVRQIRLLNNRPVFRQVSVAESSSVLQSQRYYTVVSKSDYFEINNLFDAATYSPTSINLGENGLIAIKTSVNSNGELLYPALSGSDEPWYLRISHSDFFFTGAAGWTMHYTTKDFINQSFDPHPPYRKEYLATAMILTNQLLKIKENIVVDQTSSMYMDIIVYHSDGTLSKALTTDITKDTYTDDQGYIVSYNHLDAVNYDAYSGFLYLDEKILIDDNVLITYYYYETACEFNKINLNPLFNQDITNQRCVVYLVPEGDHASPYSERRLFYLLRDQSGSITFSDYPDIDLVGLTWEEFLTRYTIFGNNPYQFLVLGRCNIALGSGIASLSYVDVRNRGGGLDPEKQAILLNNYPETNWLFDQARFDGHPYPGAAALLVEIPFTVLLEYGGLLTRAQVLEKIKKHLGLGVYPVVRYYGFPDPTDTSIAVTKTTATVTWSGSDYPYTFYWGNSPDKLTNSIILNANTYTLDDLLPSVTYFCLVTNIKDNSRELSQDIKSFTTLTATIDHIPPTFDDLSDVDSINYQ
jgi:hypothetical protein